MIAWSLLSKWRESAKCGDENVRVNTPLSRRWERRLFPELSITCLIGPLPTSNLIETIRERRRCQQRTTACLIGSSLTHSLSLSLSLTHTHTLSLSLANLLSHLLSISLCPTRGLHFWRTERRNFIYDETS